MAGKASPLTIILSTVIPVVFVIALIVILWRCARKRKSGLFNRGITPIADEEIESWRNDRTDEKEPIPESAGPNRQQFTKSQTQTQTQTQSQSQVQTQSHHHQNNSSVSSVQKPPSVIVYQNAAQYLPRKSGEQSPSGGLANNRSVDLPQSPVLARAPNARPGLTDESVQGDDAFIPQIKRQPSRLSKNQHQRHRSAYGAIGDPSGRDRWHSQGQGYQSRQSADNPRRGSATRGHVRGYSATANPPRMSLDEAVSSGGLSPRPLLHKSEIGRAIG